MSKQVLSLADAALLAEIDPVQLGTTIATPIVTAA